MRDSLKKPLKIFAIYALLEAFLYLLVATAAWAIAYRDAAALRASWYDTLHVSMASKVVAGVGIVFAALNAIGLLLLLIRRGEAVIGWTIALFTAALATCYFLPTIYSVAGLGGLVGAVLSTVILRFLWRVVSWPFRKIFRRKPKDAAAAGTPTPPARKAP